MSGVDAARQRLSAGWRAAVWPGRIVHAALRVGLVLVVAGVVGASALAWRLSQGPLDVAWLARRIEAAAFPAGAATHLSIGDASIAWNGFQAGADGGLEVRLRRLRLLDAAAAPIAQLQQADATVSLLRLLQLRLVPRSVALTGLRLRAERTLEGAIEFDLGGLDDGARADPSTTTLADVLGQLRQPAGTDRSQHSGLQALAQLQHASIHDARVQLDDQASGKTLRAELATLELQRQGEGGVKGAASGTVALGDALAALHLSADLRPGGGTHVEAVLAPTQALAVLGGVDAAVQAHAMLDLSPALLPISGELHVAAGGGTISVAQGTVNFEKVAVDATGRWQAGSWRPSAVALQRALLVVVSAHGGRSTTLGASGQAARQDGRINASVDLSLDHVDFGDLAGIWPEAWGGHVRPWLVENVTAGTARDGSFQLKLAGPEDQPGQLDLTDASGTMQGQDITINWLRPVPPVEHAQAVVKVLGPDVIDIAIPAASQGALQVKDGLLHFTGLSKKDQSMALTTGIQGPVADLLQLLRNPRLKLLDKHPLPIKSAGGTVAAKLQVDLPMKKDVLADQLGIAAQGELTDLRLAGLVAGRDLDHGDIQFDVTQDGLKASGPTSVGSIAGTADVQMDFRAGPPSQVLQRIGMVARATAAQLTASGVDPGGLITAGDTGLNVQYMSQRDGTGQVDVKIDLAAAGLSLGGWRKSPGAAATASAQIALKHDKLAAIDRIDASGPGMRVMARAEILAGRPLLLRVERIMLGPTEASGEIVFPARPKEPIRVRLSGPSLDLSSELAAKPARPSEGEANWVADVRFERVELGKGKALTGVTAHVEDDGRHLHELRAEATGPSRIQASITPQGKGRRVSVRAEDAGLLLREFDAGDIVSGGVLVLDGRFDDSVPSSPLTGRLDMSNFAVHNAVAVGKLLQAVTIYGIVEALQGTGVQFTRLVLPFRYDQRQLHIGETRAYSASLGLTATGWIDFARQTMDVRGTIVPAYALNSALGRIPLVGRLFSPEKGGGLVSVNYAVTGRTADPSVTVNPLSALTPGFLRRLFDVFS